MSDSSFNIEQEVKEVNSPALEFLCIFFSYTALVNSVSSEQQFKENIRETKHSGSGEKHYA